MSDPAPTDTRLETTRAMAFILGFNQPFYPLTLYLLVGKAGLASAVVLASAPFFLSVPWLSRRHALAARILLVVTCIANSILCSKALGEASSTPLFLLPSAFLAAIVFGPRERMIGIGLVVLGLGLLVGLHGRYGDPWGTLDDASLAAIATVNLYSVAVVSGVLSWFLLRRPQVP